MYAKASFSQNPWVRSLGWDALPLPSAARDFHDGVFDETKDEHTCEGTAQDRAKNEVRARSFCVSWYDFCVG